MIKKICILFTILFVSINSYPEKNIPQQIKDLEAKIANAEGREKVDLLYELGYKFYNKFSQKKYVQFAEETLALSKKINYPLGIAKAYHLTGNVPRLCTNSCCEFNL